MEDTIKPQVDAYKQWFAGRLKNANGLFSSLGATLYDAYDAEIILCCALAAAASDLWPGRNIDKVRFVELFVLYGSVSRPPPTYISVPTLYQQLQASALNEEKPFNGIPAKTRQRWAEMLNSQFRGLYDLFETSRILKWHEIDVEDRVLIEHLGDVDAKIDPIKIAKVVRSYAYATLMYEDLRCGLVHQYGLTGRLSRLGILRDKEPYYQRWLNSDGGPDIRLCWPYEYTLDCVQQTFAGIFKNWDELVGVSTAGISIQKPDIWWLDGRQESF